MPKFTDNKGREWLVEITVTTVKRVKALAGIDINGVFDNEAAVMQKLMGDPETLVNVLFAVCQPQAKEKGITDEQFGEGFGGDSLDAAVTALLEAITDFFPKDRRTVLKKIVSKAATVQAKGAAAALAMIESPEMDRRLDQLLQTFGGSSGPTPASSASTPAP